MGADHQIVCVVNHLVAEDNCSAWVYNLLRTAKAVAPPIIIPVWAKSVHITAVKPPANKAIGRDQIRFFMYVEAT